MENLRMPTKEVFFAIFLQELLQMTNQMSETQGIFYVSTSFHNGQPNNRTSEKYNIYTTKNKKEKKK